MTYSVLTKITNNRYNGQKFYMYKDDVNDALKVSALTLIEAQKLESILKEYPVVFSENEIIPRDTDEIKLLEIPNSSDDRPLDFDFEFVIEDCPEIIEKLEVNFNARIFGIDRIETVRQTFEN